MAAYNDMKRDELVALRGKSPPGFVGVEQSEQVLQWVWENFAAVAGDHPSFEAWRESNPTSPAQAIVVTFDSI